MPAAHRRRRGHERSTGTVEAVMQVTVEEGRAVPWRPASCKCRNSSADPRAGTARDRPSTCRSYGRLEEPGGIDCCNQCDCTCAFLWRAHS